MDASLKVGVPTWIVGIIGAFALSREMGWATVIGYLSQWGLKAPKGVPDWVAPVTVTLVCAAVWCFILGNTPKALPIPTAWWGDFGTWAFAAMGAGSAAGRTAGAPKTNSVG